MWIPLSFLRHCKNFLLHFAIQKAIRNSTTVMCRTQAGSIIYGLEQPLFQAGFIMDLWTYKCVHPVQTFVGLVHYAQHSVLFKRNRKEDVSSSMLQKAFIHFTLLPPQHCSLLDQPLLSSPEVPFCPLCNFLSFPYNFLTEFPLYC